MKRHFDLRVKPYRLFRLALAIGVALSVLSAQPCWSTPAAPIHRGGYVSVTLTPLMADSNLTGTSYMGHLEDYFTRQADDLGHSLAGALEMSVFNGSLQTVSGIDPDRHLALRSTGHPDSFLVAVDLQSEYGLSQGSFLGACLSGASCLLLSPVDIFRYRARTEAVVSAFYFTPEGQRISLVDKTYRAEREAKGDFFDSMSLARELEWIRELTERNHDDIKRAMLAELPAELMRRARVRAADQLARKPLMNPFELPPPRMAQASPTLPPAAQESSSRAEEGAELEQPFDLQRLTLQASRSTCRVLGTERVASGFVLSSRGYLVTDQRVVEGRERVKVRFHNQDEIPARVIYSAPSLQLAVLAVQARDLPPFGYGQAAAHRPGDRVVAFGYPAEMGLSVTPGEIAGFDTESRPPHIRLNRPLPASTTGGPLLNERGDCIGIIVEPERKQALILPIEEVRANLGHLMDPEF